MGFHRGFVMGMEPPMWDFSTSGEMGIWISDMRFLQLMAFFIRENYDRSWYFSGTCSQTHQTHSSFPFFHEFCNLPSFHGIRSSRKSQPSVQRNVAFALFSGAYLGIGRLLWGQGFIATMVTGCQELKYAQWS